MSTQVSTVAVSSTYPYMTFYTNGKRARVQIFISFEQGRDRAEQIANSIIERYPTSVFATWDTGSKIFEERYWSNAEKRLVRTDRRGFIVNIPMKDVIVPSVSRPNVRKIDLLRAWVEATQKPRIQAALEATLAAPEAALSAPDEDAIVVASEIVAEEPSLEDRLQERQSELEAMKWSDLVPIARGLGMKTVKGTKKLELIDFILDNEF